MRRNTYDVNASIEESSAPNRILSSKVFELEIMRDYFQVGAALELRVFGEPHAFFEYSAGAELMQPFYTSIDTTLKGIEYLNVRIDGLVRLKVGTWLMIDGPKPPEPACPECPECGGSGT